MKALGMSTPSTGGGLRAVVSGKANKAVDAFVLRPLQMVTTLRASKGMADLGQDSERASGVAKNDIGRVLEKALQCDADYAVWIMCGMPCIETCEW
ncbi:hypothetical protein CSUI_005524, partial [Cystoisospora suis]